MISKSLKDGLSFEQFASKLKIPLDLYIIHAEFAELKRVSGNLKLISNHVRIFGYE